MHAFFYLCVYLFCGGEGIAAGRCCRDMARDARQLINEPINYSITRIDGGRRGGAYVSQQLINLCIAGAGDGGAPAEHIVIQERATHQLID